MSARETFKNRIYFCLREREIEPSVCVTPAHRPTPSGRGQIYRKNIPELRAKRDFFGFTYLKQHCVLDFCAKMTPKIQKLVTLNPAGCYIDQNLTCDIPIEQSFYKAPFGSWQCYNCASKTFSIRLRKNCFHFLQ